MAGRPKRKAALDAIEKRGGVDYLTEYLLSGGTVTQLAGELGLHRGYLHRLLKESSELSSALEAAREDAAEAHAEAGFEIMRRLRAERKVERETAKAGTRAAELNSLDVSIAKEEAAQHRFIAEAWNQRRYGGGKNQTHVTVNLGDMHLDALKKMKTVRGSDPRVIDHDDG
jgi:AraC-like DNA-binding protein